MIKRVSFRHYGESANLARIKYKDAIKGMPKKYVVAARAVVAECEEPEQLDFELDRLEARLALESRVVNTFINPKKPLNQRGYLPLPFNLPLDRSVHICGNQTEPPNYESHENYVE